jgi:DNA-binding SARP family transcriptional activator/tetratricopeptide (TPR) repeat protein
MGTRFRLLGTIEARVDGRVLDVGHLRQWCVLAALLLDANTAVTVDELVDRVWGERPPQRARETLYGYLSRLRAALSPGQDVQITRRPAGYVLTVDPDAVDVGRFHRLVATARATADGDTALNLFGQALALWRGEAFAVLDTPWLNGMRATLDRARHAAALDRNDLALAHGRCAGVLDEISAAAAAYPLDERLVGQLMLALYGAGRPGDALACFRAVRERLAEELGLEPGDELAALHRRILRADRDLRPSIVERAVPVPRQVPVPPQTFSGRAAELAELARLTEPPALCVVIGPGGIGKTWLAQRFAEQQRARYPDGQLYTDLRGFDPASPPVPAAIAVRGFLDALGVAPEAVPADLDAQTALYRSLIADKRVLIVLDNARDSAHAAPLLPGAAGATVVVTSRHQLTGLVTAHGARPLVLGLLPDGEARLVLAAGLGDRRVCGEPAAADAVLRHCGGLPLALGIVAARAAVHPDLPLAALASELDEAATRLDALDAGELAVDLRAVLSSSIESLAPPAARLFALLGLVPGPEFGLAAAASLAGQPLPVTRTLLRQLVAAHLAAEPEPGRYRMHDLLRLYAAEHAGDQPEARRRLFDHYLQTAYAANRLLAPFRAPIKTIPPSAGVSVTTVDGPQQALAWFTTEHSDLLAAVRQAADTGFDGHSWQLAWTLATYHDRHGHWHDQVSVHTVALDAAERTGEPCALAYALRGLASALIWLGRYTEARELLDRAIALDCPSELAYAYRIVGRSHAREGSPHLALEADKQALVLYEAAGDRSGQATVRNAIGWHYAHLGEYEQALTFCHQAMALFHELGDSTGTALTSDSLGFIHRQRGSYAESIRCYERAVRLYEELSERYDQAIAIVGLGDTHALSGDVDRAQAAWRRAATMLEELGVPAAPVLARFATAM